MSRAVFPARNDANVLASVQQPIEVITTDGGSSNLTGPIIIGCAALAAAALAAYWQWAQLRHDRLVRDREYGRDVIGTAVDSYTTAVITLSELAVATEKVDQAERKKDEAENLDPDDDRRVEAQQMSDEAYPHLTAPRNMAGTAVKEMSARYMRLRIALGPDSEVASTYSALARECSRWFESLTPESDWRVKRERATEANIPIAQTAPLREDFERACLAWAAKES